METGLALSGGAARGIAHIGVIKYLEEKNIKPDIIAGTSAGAIVGSLDASGFTSSQLEEVAREFNWREIFRLARIRFPKMGLLQLDFLDKILKPHLEDKNFENLNIPLVVVTVDLNQQAPYFITHGPLIPAIKASSAIPGIFFPVTHHSRMLVDGGLLHNIPTLPLSQNGVKKIIAVDVHAHRGPEGSPRNIFEVIYYSLFMLSKYRENEDAQLATHLIVPDLEEIGMWDLTQNDELIELGYKKAREVLG